MLNFVNLSGTGTLNVTWSKSHYAEEGLGCNLFHWLICIPLDENTSDRARKKGYHSIQQPLNHHHHHYYICWCYYYYYYYCGYNLFYFVLLMLSKVTFLSKIRGSHLRSSLASCISNLLILELCCTCFHFSSFPSSLSPSLSIYLSIYQSISSLSTFYTDFFSLPGERVFPFWR